MTFLLVLVGVFKLDKTSLIFNPSVMFGGTNYCSVLMVDLVL